MTTTTINRITTTKIYDSVIMLLRSLTYEVKPDDDELISYFIDKVCADVKIKCNISEIPEDLYYVVIEMVCGEFLNPPKFYRLRF